MEIRNSILTPVVALLVSMSSAALAGPTDIHANDAIHIVFPTDMRADINRSGDGFYVDVDHDPVLPDGTRLYGHVLSVYMATSRKPASMRMQFDTLQMPHGDRLGIEAIPIALNDPHLTHGTNGRLVAEYKPGDQAAYTVGGAAGGLIVGGILHRPIAGAFIGAIIGTIAGHEDRHEKQNLIVSKGDHMAALFETDVTGEASTPPPTPPTDWRFNEGGHRAASPYYEGHGISIRFNDDRVVRFETPLLPYRSNGTIMVPLDAAADRFGADVTHRRDGRISIEGPERSIDVWKGSDHFRTDDGRTGFLRTPVEVRHGSLYVPIEAFATVRHEPIVVNGRIVPPLP